MTKIWLPVSAGKNRIQRQIDEYHDPADAPEVYRVGPNRAPILIPGASEMDPIHLRDIIQWQDELAYNEAKKEDKKKEQFKAVTADQVQDFKNALKARSQWEEKKRVERGDSI